MPRTLRVVLMMLALVSFGGAFAQTIQAWGTLRLASGYMAGLAGGMFDQATTITLATTRSNRYKASLDRGRAIGDTR